MAEITAALVKDLRERTGAGMMECKKALVEAKANRRSRSRAAQAGHRSAGKKSAAPPNRADRQLYPCRRPARRPGGSQLRVGFRGPHRRFQGTGARYRDAHRGRRSALHPQGRRAAEVLEKENEIPAPAP